MAKNLRAKLPPSDHLIVYDKNEEAASRFAKENQGVEVATSVRHVAEKSVCQSTDPSNLSLSYDEFFFQINDLSWEVPCVPLFYDSQIKPKPIL